MISTNATTAVFNQIPKFFGLALTTRRVLVSRAAGAAAAVADGGSGGGSGGGDLLSYFPHEALIAAVAVAYFRWTVRVQHREPAVLRWFFCGLLAALAGTQKSYELIAAVEIFSYAVPWLMLRPAAAAAPRSAPADGRSCPVPGTSTFRDRLVRLLSIAAGALVSMLLSHALFSSAVVGRLVKMVTPRIVVRFLLYLFPVTEMAAVYDIMGRLAIEKDVFEQMIQHLFFVTFHIQVGMGFLGIAFLRAEQGRRNLLIRLDVDDTGGRGEVQNSHNNGSASSGNGNSDKLLEKSRVFQRGAAPFSKYHASRVITI